MSYRTKEHTMETYFSKNLKTFIKKKIKGEVHCTITMSQLIVDIYGANNIVYRYYVDDLAQQICQGLTSEWLSYYIVKQYKRYIKNLYFL